MLEFVYEVDHVLTHGGTVDTVNKPTILKPTIFCLKVDVFVLLYEGVIRVLKYSDLKKKVCPPPVILSHTKSYSDI